MHAYSDSACVPTDSSRMRSFDLGTRSISIHLCFEMQIPVERLVEEADVEELFFMGHAPACQCGALLQQKFRWQQVK